MTHYHSNFFIPCKAMFQSFQETSLKLDYEGTTRLISLNLYQFGNRGQQIYPLICRITDWCSILLRVRISIKHYRIICIRKPICRYLMTMCVEHSIYLDTFNVWIISYSRTILCDINSGYFKHFSLIFKRQSV